MYNIWMRNYPQADINITEEWDLIPFSSLKRANAFITDLEKTYAQDEWTGHPLHNAKFYAENAHSKLGTQKENQN